MTERRWWLGSDHVGVLAAAILLARRSSRSTLSSGSLDCFVCVCVAIGVVVVLVFSAGCGAATRALSKNPAASPAQALRMCVDRWNQDNMLGWGPTLVSISVRRLDAREQDHVGVYDR